MKRLILILSAISLATAVCAQFPEKISYQAVVRNAAGKLIQNSPVGIRITVLQGSSTGTEVYSETHQENTNVNGLVTIQIGGGATSGDFSSIDWSSGPFFLKSETDPAGGTNYTITGVSQLLSVPYALHAKTAENGFSGDYNDLKNKPVTDGSETKVTSGSHITVTGSGTADAPYVINAPGNGYPYYNKTVLTHSQSWTVPDAVSRIRVELWGASGGGGGAGAYSYSYSYILNTGGDGGSGGYAMQELVVTPNQQFDVIIGTGGYAGDNAYYAYPGYTGDTDGGAGGTSWFGPLRAAGGYGGKRGSYMPYTVGGNAGTANSGNVTGYADPGQSPILNVFYGLERSYLNDRVLTSKPGKGGFLNPYSGRVPTQGEAGAAVITLFE